MKTRILVIDDDKFMRESLLDTLGEAGNRVTVASSASEGLEALEKSSFDLIITDLKMPGMSGLELLEEIRAREITTPIVMITAHGTVETAVEAMKRGAHDYILKPFGTTELRLVVEKVLDHHRLRGENSALKNELRRRDRDVPFIGESPPMLALKDRMEAIADSEATVLVHGETGVGKELVARSLHYGSKRADRPYLCVNCAALSAGLLESELFGHERGAFTGADKARAGRFEEAEGGTLLLDEVSEIDVNLQAKLLRVLQEREFERVGSSRTRPANVRVVATTNRDLRKEVREGRFREDLYFRLNTIDLSVPPLRERKEDLPTLIDTFLGRALKRAGKGELPLAEESRRQLHAYHWPGNVRELENIIERAALLSRGDAVVVEGLGVDAPPAPALSLAADAGRFRGMSLSDVERVMIEDTLRQNDGHQRKSAESLGIGVRTLRDKIKKWDLRIGSRQSVAS